MGTLKASDIKEAQKLENSIKDLDIDSKYVTDAQKKKMDSYSDAAEKAEKDGNYAEQISQLQKWLSYAQDISTSIKAQKTKASSQAASAAAYSESVKAAAQSARAAAAESTAQSIAQSKKAASGSQSTSSTKASGTSGKSGSGTGSGSYSTIKGDFVFPGSSSSYLTKSNLKGLSSSQLMIARNEIYARHGRKFDDPGLRAYFQSKSWYKGTVSPANFSDSVFNKYEKANIMLIKQYEGI